MAGVERRRTLSTQGECNDVPGMFPSAFVERLFGSEPPASKETLLFQATCLYAEAGERRMELLDALTQPDKRTGKIPRSISMQLDDKFYFVEFAKKVGHGGHPRWTRRWGPTSAHSFRLTRSVPPGRASMPRVAVL